MADRYRACPNCGFEQPETAMSVWWLTAPDKPWRTGYLMRACRGCKAAYRAERFELRLIETNVRST